jgi:hypothetical protein
VRAWFRKRGFLSKWDSPHTVLGWIIWILGGSAVFAVLDRVNGHTFRSHTILMNCVYFVIGVVAMYGFGRIAYWWQHRQPR